MGMHNKIITNEMCTENSRSKFDNSHLTLSTDKPSTNPILYITAIKVRDEQYITDSYVITAISSFQYLKLQ